MEARAAARAMLISALRISLALAEREREDDTREKTGRTSILTRPIQNHGVILIARLFIRRLTIRRCIRCAVDVANKFPRPFLLHVRGKFMLFLIRVIFSKRFDYHRVDSSTNIHLTVVSLAVTTQRERW